MTRFREMTGYMAERKTILCNDGHSGANATSTFAKDDCTGFIDQGQTATIVYPISGLHVDDVIDTFRVVGALGAVAANATVVDANLRKVTKGAGAVTDASIDTITQVSVVADTALDSQKVLTTGEIVSDDFDYYVLVTGTTANNAACDISLIGIEIDLNQKRPILG